MNWRVVAAVGVGGALGTILRYLLNLQLLAVGSPFATLIANIAGSLLLGFLTGWFIYRLVPHWVKAGLGVGFCGGFTTMSALAADAVYLYENLPFWYVGFYVVISIIGGITAALTGYRLGGLAGGLSVRKRGGGQG